MGGVKVSVVIPTYHRGAEMVSRAVESALNQTYQDLEVLVIDDNEKGSTYSKKLKKEFQHKQRVRCVKYGGNRGACAARNIGIKLAVGEYIGFLDDDDEWYPDKIEKQLKMFQQNVGMVFCRGTIVRIDKDGIRTEEEYYNGKKFKSRVSLHDMLRYDHIGTTTQALIKKECFIKCGGFREDLAARQDYEMWLRILHHYEAAGVDEPLFCYYIHNEEQITKNPQKALQGYLKVYKSYRKDFHREKESLRYILDHIVNAAAKCKGKKIVYLVYKIKRRILLSL